MACQYTIDGKTYQAWEFEDYLKAMPTAEAAKYMDIGSVTPAAPFITKTESWLQLGIKRMIAYAIENGYDKVAFVNGQQSAERYDLSKSVGAVYYTAPGQGVGRGTLVAMPVGSTINDSADPVLTKDDVPESEIENYIGKEVAKKLLESPVVDGFHSVTGDGLKVGGEGMKSFYDKIVPQNINDVLKKLGGGKAGTVSLNTKEKNPFRLTVASNGNEYWVVGEDPRGNIGNQKVLSEKFDSYVKADDAREALKTGAQEQTGFTITPELRAKAEGGMPLFTRPGSASKNFGAVAGLVKKAYAGLSAQARDAVDAWNTNWSTGALEKAFQENNSVAKEIRAAFAPARAKLREIYGDTVPLYRGESGRRGEPSADTRKLFSWTPLPKVAKQFAADSLAPSPAPVTDAQIADALAQYEKAGFVTFRGTKYKRNNESPEYFDIYDRDNNYITDGDNLAETLAERKESIDARIAELKDAPAYFSMIPVDKLIWIPQGENLSQPEIIAEYNPRKDDATRFTKPEGRTIEVDGVRRPITNSKGQNIGSGFVEQSGFWRWFSDSAVVDASGKPLVVYHGSPSGEINSFKDGAVFLTERNNVADTYATKNGDMQFSVKQKYGDTLNFETKAEAQEAKNNSGGKISKLDNSPTVYAVYVKMSNPLEVDADGGQWNQIKNPFASASAVSAWKADLANVKRDEKIQGKTYTKEAQIQDINQKHHFSVFSNTKRIAELAKENGYDGVIFKNLYDVGNASAINAENVSSYQGSVFAVFSPNQIKSATGNNGEFDSNNDDIRYSKSTMGTLNAAQQAAYERTYGTPKTFGQRVKEFTKDWQKNVVQGVFDVYAPVRELSEKAYVQLRMSKGGDSTLEALMLYGKVTVDADGFYQSDYTKANGKQGFAVAMSKLQGEHDRFLVWVSALRADRLKSIGLENLMSQADIDTMKTLNRGSMKSGDSREALYLRALKDLNEFNDSVLKIASDSGLIDDATRQMYKDTPYVPFYRLQENEGVAGFGMKAGAVNQTAWKKLKGGTDKLNEDLLANLLQNWSHLITASAKNRAAKTTLDAAVGAGIAARVPSGTPGKGQVRYRENGSDKTFIVSDEHVMDAITGMEYAGLGPWATPLTAMKRYLTVAVTVNPAFKVRNLIRDSVQSIGIADVSYNPIENVTKGWKLTADDSETRAQMLASGGMIRFGSMLDGSSSDRAKSLIAKGVDPAHILDTPGKVKSLWDKTVMPAFNAYQELGDRGEQVNRAALYERMIAKGMEPGMAAFMARDMMDFSSTGKWTAVRFLTQVVPFMNARLQGLYKLGRATQEGETWKVGNAEFSKRMGYVLGTVSLASIALMLAYKDDDDWKKREDSDRQTYWWFKVGDISYRIPKPFEIGAVGTIAEMGVELFASDDMDGKRFTANLGKIVGSQLSMNPIPQLVKPMLDVYANKDSFTERPIESMAMQRLQAKDRYTERTSEVARFLGGLGLPDPVMAAMGHYNELSPVKVDALIRGYFSWVGTMATTALDYGIRPMMDRGERPAMRLEDVFLVGNFVKELPSASSRYVSKMYDQAHIIEQAYASYHEALKMGDLGKAAKIRETEGDKLAKYSKVQKVKQAESKIGLQMKLVTASRTLSPDQKRVRLDELNAQRDKIARVLE